MTWYTLAALAREWAEMLPGAVIGEAYSQQRDELSVPLEGEDGAWTLRVVLRGALRLAFLSEGGGRARRNTAALMPAAAGRRIERVRVAERDRFLYLDLEDGGSIQLLVFGPRPNVLLVDAAGMVVEAFQRDAELSGTPAPEPRQAARIERFEDFAARWRPDRKSTEHALAAAVQLFDRTLAAEAIHRAGLDPIARPDALSPDALRRLYQEVSQLETELLHPAPRIFWHGRRAEVLALAPMRHLERLREEAFERVDRAVQVFARRLLAQEQFDALYRPLERALVAAHARLSASAARMLEELASESRGERYEAWGHLLTAQAAGEGPGNTEIILPDLFEGGGMVAIPLDPALSAIENAARYYDRARRARQAREHAETRWAEVARGAEQAGELLERLRAAADLDALRRLIDEEKDALARFAGEGAAVEERFPFRRFVLPGGWEVWAGRNAKNNQELTFRHARKDDLWMHARGVPGSHVVLRRPNRQAVPDRRTLEAAAGIAAHFSEARTSELVPVQVTERKYVRPLKGAPPGTVRVDREDVLIVEPRLPD